MSSLSPFKGKKQQEPSVPSTCEPLRSLDVEGPSLLILYMVSAVDKVLVKGNEGITRW